MEKLRRLLIKSSKTRIKTVRRRIKNIQRITGSGTEENSHKKLTNKILIFGRNSQHENNDQRDKIWSNLK